MVNRIVVTRGVTYEGKQFLQRADDTEKLPSGVVTIMFTDIVNSCALKTILPGGTSAERDEQFRQQIKKPHDDIIDVHAKKHSGRLIKSTGDGFFFLFINPASAVKCAVEIQDELRRKPIPIPMGDLEVRIGLHTGYAESTEGDIYSTTVDKAARLQSIARPGEVVMSVQTQVMVEQIHGVTITKIKHAELKGLGSIDVFSATTISETPDTSTTGEDDAIQLERMFHNSPRHAIRWAYGFHTVEAIKRLCDGAQLSGGPDAENLFNAGLIAAKDRDDIGELERVAELAENDPDFNIASEEIWRLCQIALTIAESFKETETRHREAFFGRE